MSTQALSKTIDIHVPALHSGQLRALRQGSRFNVLNCGRRWGKTIFLIDRLVDPALDGYPVAWFSPNYRMMSEIWQTVVNILAPVIERPNAAEHRLELITGGVIDMWSLDAFDSARGRKYKRVVIDEAAIAPRLEEAWNNVIRPTLTDYRGDAWFASTPKGRNFFWQLYKRGETGDEPDWTALHMPTLSNPLIDPAEVESARRDLPERSYRQEYLAEFMEDGGSVFRKVRECVTHHEQFPFTPYTNGTFVAGLDWAMEYDYTVGTVIDIAPDRPRVVEIDRFNQIDWQLQRERVKNLHRKWNTTVLVGEANSIGGPNVEALANDGIPIMPFTTTNATKTAIINNLIMAIENKAIELPDYPPLLLELEAYEMGRTPLGTPTFSAPPGQHDDCVMSLALAWSAADASRRTYLT